jgi:restriction system protein
MPNKTTDEDEEKAAAFLAQSVTAQATRNENHMVMAGMEQSRTIQIQAGAISTSTFTANLTVGPAVLPNIGLLMQTVVELGAKTQDGHLIQAVTLPWFAIVEALQKDPSLAYQMTPEQWEHMVAGAYSRAGFEEVTITPRSGDFGCDVIAVKYGLGTFRIIDQVKAYKPGHLVTADDVRALLGVLDADGASKGFLTTTSDFAPRLPEDRLLKKYLGLPRFSGRSLVSG